MPDEPHMLGYVEPSTESREQELPEGEVPRALSASVGVAVGVLLYSWAATRVLYPSCMGCAPNSRECNRVEFWSMEFPALVGVGLFAVLGVVYARGLMRRGYRLFYRSSDQRVLLILHCAICFGMLVALFVHDLSYFDD